MMKLDKTDLKAAGLKLFHIVVAKPTWELDSHVMHKDFFEVCEEAYRIARSDKRLLVLTDAGLEGLKHAGFYEDSEHNQAFLPNAKKFSLRTLDDVLAHARLMARPSETLDGMKEKWLAGGSDQNPESKLVTVEVDGRADLDRFVKKMGEWDDTHVGALEIMDQFGCSPWYQAYKVYMKNSVYVMVVMEREPVVGATKIWYRMRDSEAIKEWLEGHEERS
jgi:hypothetical protein